MEFLKGQPHFPAGEIGAETEVCAAGAESDLGIRVPRDVESPRVGKFSFVTVGRAVPHGDFVAGLQATQIPINTLVDAFTRAAPIAQQFHLSIGETVAVMAQFDQAGIDPSRTMFTLASAAKEATKDHKDFATVLNDEINQIRNAATEKHWCGR